MCFKFKGTFDQILHLVLLRSADVKVSSDQILHLIVLRSVDLKVHLIRFYT